MWDVYFPAYIFLRVIHLFIFSWDRSLMVHVGFVQLQQARATLCCGAWAPHGNGLSCCRAWALGTQASVVAAHRLSSCTWAYLLHGMWELPGPGIKPLPSALGNPRFLTTGPSGKPPAYYFKSFFSSSSIMNSNLNKVN